MMLKSGVSVAVKRSKFARVMPRRSASVHRPAMQLPKSPAAARMASAVISGLPEAPDCPLHWAGAVAAGTELGGGG